MIDDLEKWSYQNWLTVIYPTNELIKNWDDYYMGALVDLIKQ